MNKLLKEKAIKKTHNPTFTRTDNHKKVRLGSGWRKPKGWHNKIRLHKKGYKQVVSPGYGTPAELRHSTMKGLAIITIATIPELTALNPKKEAALISKVGRKKKEEIIEAAKKLGVSLVNLPVKSYQEKTQSVLKAKQDKKEAFQEKVVAKEKKAKQAEETAKKKAAETEVASEEKTAEDKKAEEKKEQDKVLTSKKGM